MITKFTALTPNIVWHLKNGVWWGNPPGNFEEKLQPLFSKIYPKESICSMLDSDYNPIILGYTHRDPLVVMEVIETLTELGQSQPRCKVAMEILPPDALEWIIDFLRDMREYKEHGTIGGEKPTEKLIADLKAFGGQLQTGWESLLPWLLENGFHVINIKHPDAMTWLLDQGLHNSRFVGKEFSGIPWRDLHHFYTAIRRDIFGLNLLEKERPEIICVGLHHAIKYDFLLGRDGKRSYYFLDRQFLEEQKLGWEMTLQMWKASHELYLLQPPR